MKQRTIAKPITVVGTGLHSGRDVTLSLLPSDVNTGIYFQRTDISESPSILADAFLVSDTVMSSNLVLQGVRISTVEHLLSAVAGFGIDNLKIEISDAEIPIMDGSARFYIQMLLDAGIQEQEDSKQFMRILKKVCVIEGDKWAEIIPFNGFELDFEIEFSHPAIPQHTQHFIFEFSTQNFIKQLGDARTFGFMRDIAYLKENNLALGGSLDNAIVLDDKGIMNTEGLRHPDEFVRHKVLDAVGDLYLAKYPLIGKFRAFKSGHALNNKLIKALYANEDNFEIVTFHDKDLVPIDYKLPKSR